MKEEMTIIEDKKPLATWSYQVLWLNHTKQDSLIDESESQTMIHTINEVCTEQGSRNLKVSLNQEGIRLEIESTEQINLGKVIKAIQKKIMKSCHKDLRGWQCLVITSSRAKAKENIRIQKLLNELWSVAYYDLDEALDSKEMTRLKQYLENRRLAMTEINEAVYLIDEEALKEEINLNCFACTKKYQYGCCCGTPCGFSEKNMRLFDRHMLQMEEAIKEIDEKQYERLQNQGGFMTVNGKLRAYDGHCSLLVEEDGCYKCIAHKYALDRAIPVYELCPLSCLMYPLEILELMTTKRKKVVLLTSVTEADFAESFGRWGSYESLEVDLKCIHKKEHDEVFKEKDYKPIYEVNQGLIMHEFGQELYKGIKYLMD